MCNSLLQVLMAQESDIAVVLKEQGRKKTKEQVLKDIMTVWARSGDKRMNNLSFTQVNHGKLSDYDSSLVQLPVRIKKNQKREEDQKVETVKEKTDKVM